MNEKIAQMIRDLNLGFEHIEEGTITNMPETIGVFYPSGMSVCEFSKQCEYGGKPYWVVESYNQLKRNEIAFIQQCLEILDGVAA